MQLAIDPAKVQVMDQMLESARALVMVHRTDTAKDQKQNFALALAMSPANILAKGPQYESKMVLEIALAKVL